MKKQKNIVSFSGGKDSTAMLLLMIEKNIKIDEIIFLDTGMEFPAMYQHIKQVERFIDRSITILRAEKSFEYMMLEYEKQRGKNKGQKGYSWPDFRNRWCTSYLKKQVIKKYLKKYKDYEIVEFHGIAVDEVKRLEKNNEKNVRYPLAEWNITEKEALEYCYNIGFNWDGLYNNFDRVSCWCCPLKNLKELKTLYLKYPVLWDKLKEWEQKTYRKFRSDYDILDLEYKFKKEGLDKNELQCSNSKS
ncbi:MAG: phosphoadenosine phosphosulfate reductase family protein [Fusobacterium sp.]|uniref:phosphoadenosine phosphosulfate reductase domain-containing protein n=1 Tax=Fusobacterium sp. TaxID=68766 RepID=UPI003991DBD7